MKRNRYIPYAAILYLMTGCTRLKEWEKRGSPDLLPPEIKKQWYEEQRQRDLQFQKDRYNWWRELR